MGYKKLRLSKYTCGNHGVNNTTTQHYLNSAIKSR